MDKHYKNEPWALEMDEILKAIGDRGKGITDATTFYDFNFYPRLCFHPHASATAERLMRAIYNLTWPVNFGLMSIIVRLISLDSQNWFVSFVLGISLYLVLVDVNYSFHH